MISIMVILRMLNIMMDITETWQATALVGTPMKGCTETTSIRDIAGIIEIGMARELILILGLVIMAPGDLLPTHIGQQ
jgi:hypothetical protein